MDESLNTTSDQIKALQKKELEILWATIQQLMRSQPEKAMQELETYKLLAEKYENRAHLTEYYYAKGYCYSNLGDQKLALEFYELANQTNPQLSTTLTNKINIGIGSIYRLNGDFSKAIELYSTALNDGSTDFLDTIYNNMAVIYYQINDFENAIHYSEKAYELLQANGEIADSLGILNNIGKIKTLQKNFIEAEQILLEAEQLAIKNQISYQQIIALKNLGELKYSTEQFEEAFTYLENGRELAKREKNKQLLYSITLLHAEVANKMKKFDAANAFYLEALDLSQKLKSTDRISWLNKYYGFLEEQHDFKRALFYLKKLHEESANINQEEKTKELSKARLLFENKEQQLKVEKLNAVNELYSKLEIQSTELSKKNKKLEDTNNDLMHFSYALSHDLREPARLVKSYSDLLTLMLKSKLNDKEEYMFKHLKNGAEKMEVLIDDLHKYATLGTNEDLKKTIDLNKIVEGVKMILKLPITESNANIESDQLPSIKSYPTLISQLFQNLISNAIKYRIDNQAPMIRITYQKLESFHEINIIDNGIGIPKEEQKRIFGLFKRATNHNNFVGTGVGLAFCLKIMSKINGSIDVFSAGENQGTTFTILIPSK
jgi:signal transduction histidine kinase/Flp pilus assembly protein TadD